MTLNGLDADLESIITSSEDAYEQQVEADASGVIILPPRSITSIRFK